MKLYNKTLSVVLAALVAFSVTVISVNNSYADGSESGKSCTVYYSGAYYDALGGLEGLLNREDKSEILSDLGALIGYTSKTTVISNGAAVKGTDAKHPTYSGTKSNSLAALFKSSERLADDTHEGMRMFYTNDYIKTTAWNREHVWPQSKSGGLYGKTGGGNDLHHLRPTYSNDNSQHGSNPYGYVEDGKPYYCNNKSDSYVIAYIGSDYTMEVVDEYKGDIARIYAYMVTHYPTLYDLIDKVMVGGYDTLVKWNAVDPVDGYELNRNEVAYSYQGNRNPFIDCPELVNVVWGNSDIHDIIYDTDTEQDSDVIYSDSDHVITTDSDEEYSLDYLTIEEANKEDLGSSITVRGQVSYIYGRSTVILEEQDEYGDIHTFQIYDQQGVINGKYPINTIVQVTGEVCDYNGVKQIKLPDRVVQISGHVTPIPAVECTINELEDNIIKVVVLKDVVLSEYDSSSITLTDENGNEIQCFKPAQYPEGIEGGDTVDVCCVAYIYKGELQIRIANSYDYRAEYSPEDDPTGDLIDDTENGSDNDADNGGKDLSNMSSLLGDTDCNGVLDMEDVVETQKYIAHLIFDLDDLSIDNADINGDGFVTLEDVVCMQRTIAKLD